MKAIRRAASVLAVTACLVLSAACTPGETDATQPSTTTTLSTTATMTTTTTTTTISSTTTTTTTTAAPTEPTATTIAPVGGLTEEEETELYQTLDRILADYGSSYRDIYDYVHSTMTYKWMAEGESIEEMSLYILRYHNASCYYFAAVTYLLLQRAGYDCYIVRGDGWQGGEHCWLMFRDGDDGWYYMDSLYVRSCKLTTSEMISIGYRWDSTGYPEAN